jgi:hypothetical protein
MHSSEPSSRIAYWDSLGTAASLLCMVHCVLTPVVLALSPALAALLPGDTKTHRVLLCLIVSLGLLAFVSGYRRHRRNLVLFPMFTGMALVACSAFGDACFRSPLAATVITLAGSALLILAHGLNRTFCHRCTKCQENGPGTRCGG